VERNVSGLWEEKVSSVGRHWEIVTPDLRLHCPNCEGERTFRCNENHASLAFDVVNRRFVSYLCSDCCKARKLFLLRIVPSKDTGRARVYKYSLRSFIEWSGFLTDRRGTLEHVATQLELSWLLSSDEAMTDADAFVSSELRHFESSAQETAADPVPSQLADAVYDQMHFLADDPYDCLALSRLDDLRGQFEASVAFLEPILRQQDDERIRLRRGLATMQARLSSCLDRERRVAELEK
jgi:hypothetical protein